MDTFTLLQYILFCGSIILMLGGCLGMCYELARIATEGPTIMNLALALAGVAVMLVAIGIMFYLFGILII